MIRLDDLVQRARSAEVRSDIAEARVRDLAAAARESRAARRGRVAWALPMLGAALAALALALWVRRPPHDLAAPPVAIGERVAIVAAPGARYRVVRATPGETAVVIERGTVTARLWPGAPPHHLSLSGGGATASAHGTIYSLSVLASGPEVSVAEGAVLVESSRGRLTVPAGSLWSGGAASAPAPTGTFADAVAQLRAMPSPTGATAPLESSVPGDAGSDAASATAGMAAPAGADAADAARGSAAPSASAEALARPSVAGGASPSVKDRWHRARLLRAQGHLAEATAECDAIADANDATWSPIALVEAARIATGPLADPARALAAVDRMLRAYPGSPLVPEARALRCRAQQALGQPCD